MYTGISNHGEREYLFIIKDRARNDQFGGDVAQTKGKLVG